ncbi:GNAT family N-acetyltransferase [Enterovibrio paralichthyis]|uniref:GNAT family N-acetyltransferase n=1 Tax=Enterovibrio paralichthyis TaxID=2853805 RepID=UPI001C438C3B|nr:GNAT family N-acetyltransferase [Enterovibrio paralichthyis]MBV7297387.1 GNAT family N-acetyltransferase [Enterovibrio paralichthyis]
MSISLEKAAKPEDWALIENFLIQAIVRLETAGIPLWARDEVTTEVLLASYGHDSLYLVKENGQTIGGVFILESDPLFWPKITDNDSLFFHKLVIGDAFITRGIGHRVLQAMVELTKQQGRHWLRCDCHGDRPRLRNFYESFGFYFIERREVEGFDAALYEYPCL